MIRYGLFFFVFCLSEVGHTQPSDELTVENRQLINETSRDYNTCIQQDALQQLDNDDDVRKVAAHAVEQCEHHLINLNEGLGSKSDTGLYSGLQRSIKNRAIKNLLPLLMYEKSSRQIDTGAKR